MHRCSNKLMEGVITIHLIAMSYECPCFIIVGLFVIDDGIKEVYFLAYFLPYIPRVYVLTFSILWSIHYHKIVNQGTTD